MRSGHTEAAVDLCKLAQLPPVAVICELANDDGTVMVGPQIEAFADRHKLEAHFGRRSHRLPAGAREAGRARRDLPGQDADRRDCRATPIARRSIRCCISPSSTGRSATAGPCRRRLHRCDIVSDIFGAGAIPKVLQRFKAEGRGALVYLRDGSAGVPANLRRRGVVAAPTACGRQAMARDRPRRTDPARSRRLVHPSAHGQPPHLRRPVGLRHRDRVGRADRRMRAADRL